MKTGQEECKEVNFESRSWICAEAIHCIIWSQFDLIQFNSDFKDKNS